MFFNSHANETEGPVNRLLAANEESADIGDLYAPISDADGPVSASPKTTFSKKDVKFLKNESKFYVPITSGVYSTEVDPPDPFSIRLLKSLLIGAYIIVGAYSISVFYDLSHYDLSFDDRQYRIGGIFVAAALPISCYDIIQHVMHYQSPLQKHYLRILLLVIVYCVDSILALRYQSVRTYLETAREAYEAFVLYTFYKLLIDFLGSRRQILSKLFVHPNDIEIMYPVDARRLRRQARADRRENAWLKKLPFYSRWIYYLGRMLGVTKRGPPKRRRIVNELGSGTIDRPLLDAPVSPPGRILRGLDSTSRSFRSPDAHFSPNDSVIGPTNPSGAGTYRAPEFSTGFAAGDAHSGHITRSGSGDRSNPYSNSLLQWNLSAAAISGASDVPEASPLHGRHSSSSLKVGALLSDVDVPDYGSVSGRSRNTSIVGSSRSNQVPVSPLAGKSSTSSLPLSPSQLIAQAIGASRGLSSDLLYESSEDEDDRELERQEMAAKEAAKIPPSNPRLRYIWELKNRFLAATMAVGVERGRDGNAIMLFPLLWGRPWRLGAEFLQNCTFGVLQYVVVRTFLATLTIVLEHYGRYGERFFDLTMGYFYVATIVNLSQMWSLYCLAVFAINLNPFIGQLNPVKKFLVIKFVVFMSFWQGLFIGMLESMGAVRAPPGVSMDDVSSSLEDLLVCVEMAIAAILHHKFMSYHDFDDPAIGQAYVATQHGRQLEEMLQRALKEEGKTLEEVAEAAASAHIFTHFEDYQKYGPHGSERHVLKGRTRAISSSPDPKLNYQAIYLRSMSPTPATSSVGVTSSSSRSRSNSSRVLETGNATSRASLPGGSPLPTIPGSPVFVPGSFRSGGNTSSGVSPTAQGLGTSTGAVVGARAGAGAVPVVGEESSRLNTSVELELGSAVTPGQGSGSRSINGGVVNFGNADNNNNVVLEGYLSLPTTSSSTSFHPNQLDTVRARAGSNFLASPLDSGNLMLPLPTMADLVPSSASGSSGAGSVGNGQVGSRSRSGSRSGSRSRSRSTRGNSVHLEHPDVNQFLQPHIHGPILHSSAAAFAEHMLKHDPKLSNAVAGAIGISSGDRGRSRSRSRSGSISHQPSEDSDTPDEEFDDLIRNRSDSFEYNVQHYHRNHIKHLPHSEHKGGVLFAPHHDLGLGSRLAISALEQQRQPKSRVVAAITDIMPIDVFVDTAEHLSLGFNSVSKFATKTGKKVAKVLDPRKDRDRAKSQDAPAISTDDPLFSSTPRRSFHGSDAPRALSSDRLKSKSRSELDRVIDRLVSSDSRSETDNSIV